MPEYFSHDYDAREDGKIIDLMGEHGWIGYGLFWGLVELLYKNGGKMRTQYQRIAFALNAHPDTIKDIVENYGLFQVKKDFFSSKSVNKRIKKRKEISEVASANARKRWDKRDAGALQPECDSNAIKERKGKEIKETKLKEFKEAALSFMDEYDEEMIKEFVDYWTEENHNKTKYKFQMEKTWSIERRLATWHKRSVQYKPESKGLYEGYKDSSFD